MVVTFASLGHDKFRGTAERKRDAERSLKVWGVGAIPKT